MPAAPARKPRTRRVTFEVARRIALSLPGVEEGMCYGTPAFRVRGRLLARIREDGESLVVKVEFDERELLVAADPETYYVTDHYRGYPWVLVRLSLVHRGDLRRLLENAWRRSAPRRLVEALQR